MQHERDEQVIFIKDLIFTALYQWRKILIAAVAFALLLGGYKAASGLPLATATTPEDSTEVAALKEKVQWQQTYMEASVVMNLNPYEIYKATLTVSVMAENITVDGSTQPVSHIGALLKSYAASLSAAMITQEAADLANTQPQYLSELVSFKTEIHSAVDGTVTVTVLHNEKEIADKLVQLATDKLPGITETVSGAVAAHTLQTYTNGISTYEADVQSKQDREKKYMVEQEAALAAAAPAAVATGGASSYKALLKDAVIFAVIGGILGCGMAACLIWLLHICNPKVYSARTLKAWTGVKVLGCAGTAGCKCPIDRRLRKLEGRADETQLAVTAAAVANYAKDGTLLICADADCPEAATKALAEKIPSAKICGSLTEDVAALEALPRCANVLLVVKCGKSLYRDVARQMQLVRDQDKELIGAVVLDG